MTTTTKPAAKSDPAPAEPEEDATTRLLLDCGDSVQVAVPAATHHQCETHGLAQVISATPIRREE